MKWDDMSTRRVGLKPSRKSASKARRTAEVRKELRYTMLSLHGSGCQWPECPEQWSDMHEVLSRGRGGDPTDVRNIMLLCRDHHHRVTTNPKLAESMGLARSMTAEEFRARYRPWE